MTKGRCAGCGYEDSSIRVADHTMDCPEFAKLYREAPDKALDPEVEYTRHQEYLLTPEGRKENDERVAKVRAGYQAEADRRNELDRERWGQKRR